MGKDAPVRRSYRARKTTERGRNYEASQVVQQNLFPSTSDEIKVKWSWKGIETWWMATVLAIGVPVRCTQGTFTAKGELLYHRLGSYEPENAVVWFFADKNNSQRLVSSTYFSENIDSSQVCSSWLYTNEVDVDDAESPETTSTEVGSSDDDRTSTVGPQQRPYNQSKQSLLGRGVTKDLGTTDSTVPNRTPIRRRTTSRVTKPKQERSVRRISLTTHGADNEYPRTPSDEKINKQTVTRSLVKKHQQNIDVSQVVNGANELPRLENRLELLEQKLADLTKGNNSVVGKLPASSLAILFGLKWLLLKRLERPLRQTDLRGLSTSGLDVFNITLRCDCNSRIFADIAAVLSLKLTNFQAQDRTYSRVGFFPDYNRIQSGSIASEKLSIAFTALSDLTDLLGIRDEDDYETILTKELINDNKNILQIMGTKTTRETKATKRESESQQSSSNDCETSTKEITTKIQTVFVGCAPFPHHQTMPSSSTTSLTTPSHSPPDVPHVKTTVFEQECLHYSDTQSCYRTNWSAKSTTTSFHIKDISNTLDNSRGLDYSKYFVLEWNRMKPPSNKKWTRDVQLSASVSPGTLLLSIPTILVSSRQNVLSLSNLLDEHIECFMKQRISLRNKKYI